MDLTPAQEVTALSQYSESELARIQELVLHTFKRPGLLATALTMPSNRIVIRNRVILMGNAHLEFVGDGILSAAVRTHLFALYPDEKPEIISTLGQWLTTNRILAHAGEELGLIEFISLPMHASEAYLSNSKTRTRAIAAVFESIIAALYLDDGMPAVHRFLEKTLYPRRRCFIEQTDDGVRLKECQRLVAAE